MALGGPRASIAALEELRVILRELGFHHPVAAHTRPQEVTDEAEPIVPPPASTDGTARLPWPAPQITALGSTDRAGVIAMLARLLFEAARPAHEREGGDDAS